MWAGMKDTQTREQINMLRVTCFASLKMSDSWRVGKATSKLTRPSKPR